MKDYTLNRKNADDFILNYKRVNNTLVVVFANGDKWVVEDTEKNENKILEEMREQLVVDSKAKEKSVKRNLLFSKGSIVLCIGAGALIGKMVNDPTICYTGLSLVALGATIPVVKIAKGQSIINDINKQRFMQKNSEEFNESIAIPTLLTGISPKARKVIDARIAQDLQPFNLNSADDLSLNDLQKIKQNLEIDKHFGFTYPDKTKQKTR